MSAEDNDFYDLPVDPCEGVIVLEKRLRGRIEEASSSSRDVEPEMREYVDTLMIYDETHGLTLTSGIPGPPTDWIQFKVYFISFERIVKKFIISYKIGAAKRRNEVETDLVTLDSKARRGIHELILEIKEQIYEFNLPETKRNSLLDKLNNFAKEVDRNITRTESWMSFAVELSKTAKEIDANLSPVQSSVDRIFKWLQGFNKAALPAPTSSLQLPGPAEDETPPFDDPDVD